MHYQRWRKHGDSSIRAALLPVAPCSQAGCGRRLAKSGVCWTHYRHFKAMFSVQQQGNCAICGVHGSKTGRKTLLLDHDHVTGRPRALLCHHCNVGIGLFRDNPATLRAAAFYLEEMKLGQLPLFAA